MTVEADPPAPPPEAALPDAAAPEAPSPEASSSEAPSPEAPRPNGLPAFLAGWFRAWQAARLYGPGHPVLAEAAAQAAAAVAALDAAQSVVVLPGGFECRGQAIEHDTAAEAIKALAEALHGMDVGSIDVAPGLSAADAQAGAVAMAEASERPVVERVNAAAGGRLSLRAVSYRGVQMRDAGRDDTPDDPAAPSARDRLWSRLNTDILDPASRAADPRLLAQQIGAEVLARPRAAMTGLRDSLVGTARALADRPEAEQRRGVERMQALLSGLGPQLRAALETAAAAQPRPAGRRAGDGAMATQITDAISRGAASGAALSSEAVMLCQKLAALGPGDPAAPADPAADAPAAAPDDDKPAEALAGALESLFSRFDPTKFTPDDYQQQIRETLDAAGPAAAWAETDTAFADQTLGVRCAHIAHDLLDGEAAAPSVALQEVIAASVVPLIDARDFAVLFERLRCGDASLGRALARDTVIDRLLEADAQDPEGEHLSVITELLRHAGDRAIDRVTQRVLDGGDAPPPVGRAATKLSDDAPATLRRGALHRALTRAAGPLSPAAAPLFARLDFKSASGLLQARLNDPDLESRRAAYELLARALPSWPATFLSQALRDRDPQVQRCVIDRLCAGQNARHLALAQVTLSGQSPAGTLGTEAFTRLAQGTLDRGTEGLWVAARVLRALAYALSPRRAARGRRLARLLRPHRGNAAVRRALLLWKLTPARWIATLAGHPAAVQVAPATATAAGNFAPPNPPAQPRRAA